MNPDRFALPPKAIVGMVHLHALPGTPSHRLGLREIRQRAQQDARALVRGGVHALLVENMHDVPYCKGAVGPEITAAVTACCLALRESSEVPPTMPVGLQILAGANQEALAVAHAAGLQFIRAEGFVFAHVADEGLLESQAATLLRYRRNIGADTVAVFCDIKKKHSSHAITADVDLAETAHAAEYFLADGLIVTGTRTGLPPAQDELEAVRRASHLPLLVGSGTTEANIATFLKTADAVIVGSSVKIDGDWRNPVDQQAVERLVQAARGTR